MAKNRRKRGTSLAKRKESFKPALTHVLIAHAGIALVNDETGTAWWVDLNEMTVKKVQK